MSLLEMEDKCGAQPREGNGHSMQINPTIISGNTKCTNTNTRKYEMQKIQIQQPSGEIQNATNTNTTTIRGNAKCYKYNNHQRKYKIQQPSGEIRNATNTHPTIIGGNTKCNKYKYDIHQGKYNYWRSIKWSSGKPNFILLYTRT